MTTTTTYVVVGIVLALAIGFSTDQPAWECSANMKLTGAAQGRGYSSVTMGMQGFLTFGGQAYGDSTQTFIATLHGKGNYAFEYSPNVTHVRLNIDNQPVYEGPPIAQFNKRGVMAISLRWTGTEVAVVVKDTCSPGSISRSSFT